MNKIHWKILYSLVVIVLITISAEPVVRQIQQNALMVELVAVANSLPQEENLKPIPCSRTPLVDEQDKAALQVAVIHLALPARSAIAFCILGDYPSALAAYTQAASAGDDWSALQIYFLQARQGNMKAAEQALSKVHFPAEELQGFFYDVTRLKVNIDVLPVARRAVELYPNDPNSWYLWREAAREYEYASDWQRALDAYLEAIRVQEMIGVNIGRSSFKLRAGMIYQTLPELQDLNIALGYYDDAIASMNFLVTRDSAYAYLHRGEVYQGLGPTYTVSQVLQEFLHCLDLDPKNYWAMRAIAGVYLYDLNDYPSAELYIDQAIGLNPDLAYAYLIRGDIYRHQGNLQGAADAYQDALTHQPGFQAALDRLNAVQAELKKQSP